MKKVSIIIPTYNGQETIEETLKSVLAQKYQNYEIIVVDDGSQDSTLEIVKHIAPLAKVIQQKNQGTMAARQNGINSSSGDLIAFLDQDDLWFDNHLVTAVNFLNTNPEYGLFVANMAVIDEQGNKLNFDVIPYPEKYSLSFESLLLIEPIATSTTVFQRKVVDEIGGLSTSYGFSGAIGDLDFFVRASEFTQLHFENKNLGIYRWAETRPGRLISFANNLKIYAKTFWNHPRIKTEDSLELRKKFVQACCNYGIDIWRLLLQQHNNKIPLGLLEKANEFTEYMQALFMEHYQESTGLRPVNLDFFPTEKELIRNLLFIYLLRRDLQELFSGVKEGSLDELLIWASDIAHQRYADGDFPAFETHNIELIYLERDIIKNKLERTEKERVSLANELWQLKNELWQLKEEVKAVYQGRSWRITAPLRKAADSARYIRQQSRRLLSLLRALPKRIVRKLIRSISLWVITHQKVYRIAIAMVNHFPEIKNRLKSQVYGPQQVMSEIPVYEQPLPMSPPVRKIYTDLVVAIKNKRGTNSTNQMTGE
jgi:glycosyltransferase involved in cell wall biosynthesis